MKDKIDSCIYEANNKHWKKVDDNLIFKGFKYDLDRVSRSSSLLNNLQVVRRSQCWLEKVDPWRLAFFALPHNSFGCSTNNSHITTAKTP